MWGHCRLLSEHDRGKKIIVACQVLIVGRGGGFSGNVGAFLGEQRSSNAGRSIPKQDEIYKVNRLDLREARHEHDCSTVWDRC